MRERLERELTGYRHVDLDIRDRDGVLGLFRKRGTEIALVIHCAGQPSHDWAATEPFTDFDVNAGGTLNLLEATRLHAPDATFIFMSTNKVYGDAPNALPLHELETRFEIDAGHPYADGIGEDMSIDGCLHSVFGASKVAADVMVQEYGRYFGLRTACFRGGTITGPQHAAAELHGFLGYVMRCALEGREYTIFGYQGKQVRDAIHCHDLVQRVRLRVPRAARRPRSTTSAAGGTRTRRCSRRSRRRRRSPAASSSWRYDETQPHRRPHLVDRLERAVRRPLPGVAPGVRRAADPDRAARGQRGALARVIDAGKRLLLGVRLDAVDYDGALSRILAAARAGQPLGVSALAVHGVMTGVLDAEQRWRINHLDLVTPDGQPVRWALNLLHRSALPDQVHGAVLTAKLLPHLEDERIAVYWYGTTPTTLALLREELARRHPGLVIAGMEPSRFGTASPAELDADRRADPRLRRADLLRRPRLPAPGDVRVGDARPPRHAGPGGRRGVHVPVGRAARAAGVHAPPRPGVAVAPRARAAPPVEALRAAQPGVPGAAGAAAADEVGR